MIRKAREKVRKILDRENRPPLLTLRIYKRHIVALVLIVWLGILAYGAYFRYFMVLPQSAANIMPHFSQSLDNQRVLIFSPHCDDETLGAAGLMQQAKADSSEIRVVMVTDCNSHKIGATRKKESRDALEELGLSENNLVFLNFPEKEKDQGKDNNLQSSLEQQIKSFNPTLIVSPHPYDTHIDHKSVGRAIEEIKKQNITQASVIFYLIHYNFLKYPSPSGLHPEDNLLPPARLISYDQKWYILPLSDSEIDVKQNAVLKYRSQLSIKNPILRDMLLEFVRKNELFMMEQ